MLIRSGIASLDERLGGLGDGELYLLAGVAGSGRLVALLQFLDAGLEDGPVGLVTAAPPSRVLEESKYWGLGLESAWRNGTFRLLSLEDDFERRLTAAPDPSEIYEEMGELLGPRIRRVAVYPGTALWDSRVGTSFASRFLAWADASEATVFAAIPANLEDGVSPATLRVLDSADGIFSIEVAADGLRQLEIKRHTPAPDDPSPITLDLVPGEGLRTPIHEARMEWGDRSISAPNQLLLLRLTDEVPRDVMGWTMRDFEVLEVSDPFHSVELVQEARDRFSAILIYLDRARVGEALRACRSLRRISQTPVVLATEESVRVADRVRALKAGASDFLAHPLSVAELASKIEHAVVAGGAAVTEPSGPPMRVEGEVALLDLLPFALEVERRLSHPGHSIFTLVSVRAPEDEKKARRLGKALLESARHADGDCVGSLPKGFGVVLQGTSVSQAATFMARVTDALPESFGEIEWAAQSGTADAAQILGELGDASAPGLTRTGT